jgi:hypothetical protein
MFLANTEDLSVLILVAAGWAERNSVPAPRARLTPENNASRTHNPHPATIDLIMKVWGATGDFNGSQRLTAGQKRGGRQYEFEEFEFIGECSLRERGFERTQ